MALPFSSSCFMQLYDLCRSGVRQSILARFTGNFHCSKKRRMMLVTWRVLNPYLMKDRRKGAAWQEGMMAGGALSAVTGPG